MYTEGMGNPKISFLRSREKDDMITKRYFAEHSDWFEE